MIHTVMLFVCRFVYDVYLPTAPAERSMMAWTTGCGAISAEVSPSQLTWYNHYRSNTSELRQSSLCYAVCVSVRFIIITDPSTEVAAGS